ncbi:MAG: CoA pyrophosphatase [Pseudomonadota bacterium]|nr:CoA pyrophosphatase [Pseudomonadota bacterium]
MTNRMADMAAALNAYRPHIEFTPGNREAVVALLLRERRDGVETLLIERAQHPDDPWSGHVALPGGRRETEDRDLHAVARREVLEETAIDLAHARRLGRLDDQPGRHSGRNIGLTVSCLVYAAPLELRPQANYEVSRIFWTPLTRFAATEYRTTLQTPYRREPYPAIRLENDATLWGMTYRFVNNFLHITGLHITAQQ